MLPTEGLEGYLHTELTTIFSKYHARCEVAERNYVFAQPLRHKKVLFVGINPSFPEGATSTPYDYPLYPSNPDEKLHPHFRRFQRLADQVGIQEDWAYADLLFLRETSQKKILRWMGDDPDGHFRDFLCDQLRLTMRLMEEVLKPQLIVVCNQAARLFWGVDIHRKDPVGKRDDEQDTNVWMGYKFDEGGVPALGMHVITGLHSHSIKEGVKQTALEGTPIIFTSSLLYRKRSSVEELVSRIQGALSIKLNGV